MELCGEISGVSNFPDFFYVESFFNEYFNTNPKKVFTNLTLLVAPARVTRLHHFVAPHALTRQGVPRWHASLTWRGEAWSPACRACSASMSKSYFL
jgi:hypothetical protein